MAIIDTMIFFVKSIRIQDILDMIIIALMIFALLTWFKTRASRFVLIGIILLGGIYSAARFFQLYLTTIVLQGFFAILLFVLVVIFQEDLRGFFERLAMLGNIRKKIQPLSALEDIAGIIAETAVNLAKKRFGALIVLQGDDPLERHINGGTLLDGIVSEPLLESIFDPHSIGHDGALIINDNRIAMFGCHLPLSINTEKYGNIGLRHTAALGLSERSDALCIVVSEERGTISLTHEGELQIVKNAAALNETLEKFYKRNAPVSKSSPVVTWLKENTREKVIAVILSAVLWLTFGYQREVVRRDVIVPIEYTHVPPNWRIDEPRVTEAKVFLKGPAQAFQLLDERSLKLSLNLAPIAANKREFSLDKDMINTPGSLSVTEIAPEKIRVYASKLFSHIVPLNVITKNSPPGNLTLQRITVTPASIRVLAEARLSTDQIKVETEPIDLQKISKLTYVDAKIILPVGVSFPEGKAPVARVAIQIKRK